MTTYVPLTQQLKEIQAMIDKREGTNNRPVQPNSKERHAPNGPTRGDVPDSQRQRAPSPFPGE